SSSVRRRIRILLAPMSPSRTVCARCALFTPERTSLWRLTFSAKPLHTIMAETALACIQMRKNKMIKSFIGIAAVAMLVDIPLTLVGAQTTISYRYDTAGRLTDVNYGGTSRTKYVYDNN